MPERLPERPRILWRARLTSKGLGGVAATADRVVISDRELNDTLEVFRCLDARDGKQLWALTYPGGGDLDYGPSARATPLIHDGLVFTFGAFGDLHCVELATGRVLWERNVAEEFKAQGDRKWGLCSSPLLAAGRLIVNPGGADASLVALEPRTGQVAWRTPGAGAGHGSLLAGTFGGREQVVGHDVDSLGGWDAATGRRLWRLVPPRPKDFNVPTPVAFGGQLLVTTENNGTRLYRFHAAGVIDPTPVAVNTDLAPDTHTPVVVGTRVFGVWGDLHCLDATNGLKTLWSGEDPGFRAYVSLVASGERLLATTRAGELLLIDAKAERYRLLARMAVFPDEDGIYAHPAFVGTRAYLRGNEAIVALELAGE